MTTISIPIPAHLEESLDNLINSGNYGETKAEVVRSAIKRLSEEEAVNSVLKAMGEPSLSGDLKELSKKF